MRDRSTRRCAPRNRRRRAPADAAFGLALGYRDANHVSVLLPEWVEPMAATLTQERFTGPDWIFERKLDGIRLLAFKNGESVRLLSRNKLAKHCPSIAAAVAKLPVRDVILHGEADRAGATSHV